MLDKDKFVKRRHFAFPHDTFVELKISPRNTLKIQEWEKNGDDIQIVPHHRWGFIVVINDTKRCRAKRKAIKERLDLADLRMHAEAMRLDRERLKEREKGRPFDSV